MGGQATRYQVLLEKIAWTCCCVSPVDETEGNVETEDGVWHYVCSMKWAHEARDVLGWWPDMPTDDKEAGRGDN